MAPQTKKGASRLEGRGFELRPYQEEALTTFKNLYNRGVNRQLLAAATGTGKAQPVDEPVLTPNGFVPMGEILPGDQVIGQDGSSTAVQSIHPQGERDIYRVRFSDGTHTRCTEDHLWNVQTKSQKHRGDGFKTKQLKELIGDIQDGTGARKWFLPLVEPVQFPQRFLHIDPYALGALLGDGSFRHHLNFHCADDFIVREVDHQLGGYADLVHESGPDYRVKTGELGCKGSSLRQRLEKLSLMGKYSHEKFVPASYKYSSVEDRLRLLRGLMDTDGTVEGGTGFFSSSSRQLADDVAEIVRSLGGTTRVREKPTTHRTSYRVTVNLSMVPFEVPRKAAPYNTNSTQGRTKAIDAVERVGKQEAQCIKVAADDGLYITKDYTVTHNTVVFSHLPEAFPDLARRGMMVVAHRRELVFQAAETLREVWPQLRVEIEMADHRASQRADIVVSSIQTLAHPKSQRLQKYDPASDIGILVIDEAHHCSTGSQYQTVCDHFGVGPDETRTLENGRDRMLLGVTATPNRHDGEGLHHFFDDIAENYDIRWGIENGWLVDIDAQRIETDTDLSEVDSRGGEFVESQLQDAINTHERNDVIVKGFVEHGGDQGLAFTAGVDQAHTLADAFETYGISAEAIDASTEKIRRKDIVRRYKAGDLEVLTNVGVATEGFDVPPCDTLLMARPTKSTTLYTQMIGRGTRPSFNPTAGTAEKRREAIAQSAKPHMRILDFCDQVGDHDLMTAPQLFGLDSEYETADETLTEAAREIEEKEEEMPGKPFRKATSLEELDVIAEQVSVWDVAQSSVEELGDETDLFWMQLSEDVVQLQIPHDVDTRKGEVTQDVSLRLEKDRLGRWQAIEQKKPVYRDGQMVLKPFEQKGKTYNTRQEAIDEMDRYARRKYSDAIPMISKGMDWTDRPATKGQLKYLRRLDVHVPDGEDLNRGKASRLINAAKAQS